jgi:DNA-binding CsgD family transcriptional regulator
MPDLIQQPDLNLALLELLDRSAFGALVVGAEGRLLAANARGRELLLANRSILQEPALREAIRRAALALVESALPLAPRGVTLQALVTPLEVGWPGHRQRLAGVLLFDLRADVLPQPALLRQLYGLTTAEARLACALVQGATLAEAARARRISIHTARHQLRRVFEKTGARRQSELMRVLLRGPASLQPVSGIRVPMDVSLK